MTHTTLEWEMDRGYLRGQPEITLFILTPEPYALRLSGAFVPDIEERARAYKSITEAKAAAEKYMADWIERNIPL